MALPVELDLKHWIKVVPASSGETAKALSFACYYANTTAPPELASEGTELAANSTVTLETPSGKWFIGKTASSTEIQKPSLLELQTAFSEGQIATEEIANEAVTPAKVRIASIPAVAAAKTVKVGTSGVDRVVIANLKGDGGTTVKYKVKHGLGTLGVATAIFKDSTEKIGEQKTTGLPKITPISTSEVELEFGAGEPANNEIIWVKVEA